MAEGKHVECCGKLVMMLRYADHLWISSNPVKSDDEYLVDEYSLDKMTWLRSCYTADEIVDIFNIDRSALTRYEKTHRTSEVLNYFSGKRIVIFTSCFAYCARFEAEFKCYTDELECDKDGNFSLKDDNRELLLPGSNEFVEHPSGVFFTKDDADDRFGPYISISIDK